MDTYGCKCWHDGEKGVERDGKEERREEERAGNEGQEGCNYYPACYDSRIIVVGSSNQNGVRLDSSNYSSKVDAYMDGYEVKADGITHSGTSQSTAKMTGILVKA